MVFSCFFFFFLFFLVSNIPPTSLLQTLELSCAHAVYIPTLTIKRKDYLECYWRTVTPSSVCICSILPSIGVYTTEAFGHLF